MAIATELVVLGSQGQPTGTCVTCGKDVAAGQGVTASPVGRVLGFKRPGRFSRFQSDPDRLVAGQTVCCGSAHDHTPASEWA